MKVYLLRGEDYEGAYHGIYSSREKALEAIPFQERELGESDIEELEVDPPHGTERYGHFYYVCYHTSSRRTSGKAWVLPSVAKELRYGWSVIFNVGTCTAYAHTPEEAEEQAKRGIESHDFTIEKAKYR